MRDAMITGTQRAGRDPVEVAALAFAAIEQGRFWVFPHPEMLAALPERLESMLAGRNPEFDFSKAFRRG